MLIIDRFEGDWAVIEYEGGKTFHMPRKLLPKGILEGAVIRIAFYENEDATAERRKRIDKLLDELFED
ncbi:MAG: DUF3006 domain-containing protein [Firmicutes bacterium]|jgi:hypothetical protein|nr:DUF3006 domain-containing protein [Bacillota bacterium]